MTLDFIKEPQLEFLKEGRYLVGDETPAQRFGEIIDKVREYEHMYSDGLADRIGYMINKGIFSCSTPVLANFGRKNSKSLPASCYIVSVGDSISEIYNSLYQVAMASKLGGGVGSDFQLVSQKGTKLEEGFFTNSKLDWIEDSVAAGQKVSQGATRRGYNTPFISIEDNDFYRLLERVNKNNPDKKDRLIDNTVGIILPEGFREKLTHDKEAQKRYMEALKMKKQTGRIYLLDVDNCNKNCSPVYKKLGLKIRATNICTEFIQPLFTDLTSVCVIGALNLLHWDEIEQNPQMIKDSFMFLDIINEEYIKLSEGMPFLEKARKSAIEKRDIGLGTLAFHDLLQSRGLAFGDVATKVLNKKIFSTIRKYGEEATVEMAEKLGSCKYAEMAGMVRRNGSLMMIAPNKSTSFIQGALSGGIEPRMSNIFLKSLAKIQYVWKNPFLEKVLEKYGKNTTDVWDLIQKDNGSVKNLLFLSDEERRIFETFEEISPKDIIDLVADRQVYIDMGQSLNLIFRKNYTMKDIYDIHKYGWEKGIKTFYYGYNSAHAALEKEGKKWDDCSSCAD